LVQATWAEEPKRAPVPGSSQSGQDLRGSIGLLTNAGKIILCVLWARHGFQKGNSVPSFSGDCDVRHLATFSLGVLPIPGPSSTLSSIYYGHPVHRGFLAVACISKLCLVDRRLNSQTSMCRRSQTQPYWLVLGRASTNQTQMANEGRLCLGFSWA